MSNVKPGDIAKAVAGANVGRICLVTDRSGYYSAKHRDPARRGKLYWYVKPLQPWMKNGRPRWKEGHYPDFALRRIDPPADTEDIFRVEPLVTEKETS